MSVVVRSVRVERAQLVTESVAKEAPVNLLINNRHVVTLLTTPRSKKELGLGWVFSEGILQSLDQIEDIVVARALFCTRAWEDHLVNSTLQQIFRNL